MVSQLNAVIFAVTLALMGVLYAFFRYTRTGIAMRAVSQNRTAAQLMGISINRMNALGWGMGTAMGAVTGMLIAPLNYLDYVLNNRKKRVQSFEVVSSTGQNVFATLNSVSQILLHKFSKQSDANRAGGAGAKPGQTHVAPQQQRIVA